MVLEIKPTAEDIEPEVSRPGLFISEPTPYGQKTHRRCRGRGVYPTEGSCRFPLIVLEQTIESFLATHDSWRKIPVTLIDAGWGFECNRLFTTSMTGLSTPCFRVRPAQRIISCLASAAECQPSRGCQNRTG